jgi:FkbM family methyltransferase
MLDCTVAYGLQFLFPMGDTAVGASLRVHGEFARTELDFLLDHAGPAATLIDVGANIGAIGLPFAHQRQDWRVLAIEAHRGMSGILAANALNNRLFNVDVFNAAAAAEAGLAAFPALPLAGQINFGAIGFGQVDGPVETVRKAALDDIAPDDTRLIKIDVEGFEPEVLKGASRLLAGHQAVWLVEAAVQHPAAAASAIATFMDAGYGVYWFYAPFVTPNAPKGGAINPGRGDTNVVALPPGVANLWDLPQVLTPTDKRPQNAWDYPYLTRYGYAEPPAS